MVKDSQKLSMMPIYLPYYLYLTFNLLTSKMRFTKILEIIYFLKKILIILNTKKLEVSGAPILLREIYGL